MRNAQAAISPPHCTSLKKERWVIRSGRERQRETERERERAKVSEMMMIWEEMHGNLMKEE